MAAVCVEVVSEDRHIRFAVGHNLMLLLFALVPATHNAGWKDSPPLHSSSLNSTSQHHLSGGANLTTSYNRRFMTSFGTTQGG